MRSNPQASRAEFVGRVRALAIERHKGSEGEELASFLERYLETVAVEDLSELGARDLYGAGVAHWRLAQHRAPREPAIAVYSPDAENHGWQSPHTVVDIVVDDMPFLVDSVTMEISRHQLGIYLVIHPVMTMHRDSDGRLLSTGPEPKEASAAGATTGGANATAVQEALLHVEVTRASAAVAEELRRGLGTVLADVRAAVEDWGAMCRRVGTIVDDLERRPPPLPAVEVAEAAALLRWLVDDHFVFLGYREYELVREDATLSLSPVAGTGLGVLRTPGAGPPAPVVLTERAAALAADSQLLVLTKANARATVHRPSRLDYVGVKRFAPTGRVIGEWRVLGLYRASAYAMPVDGFPVVRRKVAAVIERAGFTKGSHSAKSLVDVLETFPRDELIQSSDDELFETAVAVSGIQERQQVRLFARLDPFGRFVSCLVYLPRDRYTTTTRLRIASVLESALGGTRGDFTAYLSESVLVRLHILILVDAEHPPSFEATELQERVAEATRSWEEDLETALVEHVGEEEGARLLQRFATAFPAAYREDFPSRAAVADIRRIDGLHEEGDLAMAVYHPLDAPEALLRLKLVGRGTPVSLSEIVPVLEHMGVTVADEHPYPVTPAAGPAAWIYDFGLLMAEGDRLAPEKIGVGFQDTVAKVLRGEAESDGFNRLVLSAGLTWREVVVLRVVCRYLRQTQSTFSQASMEDTLGRHPEIARQLVELFEARFDPAVSTIADNRAEQLPVDIAGAIDSVDSLDDDRILRQYLHAIQAMVRTNYFQAELGATKEQLSFKFDGSKLTELPAPRPAFEVFVYSPKMEGVHLRAGHVARGGIRWSDRREDFRTEILGLMKAQTVKNAVIVPTGAKGGFVVRRPSTSRDREAVFSEGVAAYRALISGMLDLTDNLVEGAVVPPPDVVRYDGDDPYLVVAADKGTATLSDVANSIALERGFWLGDAFASGGSTGYDHKKMGITARGAWESARHHFFELGVDPDTAEITVVGIGDMSGDVFGNGMLLSPHLKLVGAFDHRHVFLDPDPDPASSYAERRRLFALEGSSWADYEPSLISKGGGVYPRTAKQIDVSAEVRKRLAITDESLEPVRLISALLRAPVDMLWSGGIGTYVKSTTETHAEVGDRANDSIRVDADDLRCRVVVEGGNLGLTQRARVQYTLAGGLVNTDAIDNSAGVDTSDHEVNIKILLDRLIAAGDLTRKQRNELLVKMEDEVAALVLRDNIAQNQALGSAKAEAAAMVGVHARLLRRLEESGKLDRALEALPTDEEIAERAAAGRGLVVPEFAVLLAYVKILTYAELLASSVPDEPHFARGVLDSFPATLRERFPGPIQAHPLRREIVATRLANSVVNVAGTSMLFRIGEETGAPVADIVRAHTAARIVFGADEARAEVESFRADLTSTSCVRMVLEIRKLTERATRWFLRHERSPIDVDDAVTRFRPGVGTLVPRIPEIAGQAERDAIARTTEDYVGAGAPDPLARWMASLDTAFSALDVIEVSEGSHAPIETVARAYFALGEVLELDWLRAQVVALPRNDRWQALARDALRDDLAQLRAALTERVLSLGTADQRGDELVPAWASEHQVSLRRAQAVISEVKAAPARDLASLCVAVRELRGLVLHGPSRR